MYTLKLFSIPLLLFFSLCNASERTTLADSCTAFRTDKTESQSINVDIPFKKGLLWRITTPEGKANHLFGTMHSQDYAVTKYPHQVRLAMIQSNTMLMESIPDKASNDIFLQHIYFNDGTQLNTLIENEFYDRLSFIAVDYGIPESKVNSLKPWAAFSMIGRPKPVRAPTLEMNLLGFARNINLEVDTLETMEEIIDSLESINLNDQIIILKDTICNHSKIIQSTKKLVGLYVNRDLEGMVKFNRQPHHDEAVFERFMQSVLYGRNIRMLQRIETAFKEGGVFVSVGASHLSEEQGLLQQLNLKGYKVELIY